MQPNQLTNGPSRYELAIVNSTASDVFAAHRGFDFPETFAPSFSLDVLVDDYLSQQDLETKRAYKVDDALRLDAVEEIFKHVTDCHEYAKVWEARVEGEKTNDYLKAQNLAKRLYTKIEERLIRSSTPRFRLFDTDEPTPEMVALIDEELDQAAEVFSKKYYDEQDRLAAERKDGLPPEELRGQEDGLKLFQQWLTDPSVALDQVALIRKHFEEGTAKRDGEPLSEAYVRGVEFAFHEARVEREMLDYVHQTDAERLAAKEKDALAHAETVRDKKTLDEIEGTVADVLAANNATTPQERERAAQSASEQIKQEKEKTNMSSNFGPSGNFGTRTYTTNKTTPGASQNKSGETRPDAGFHNYDVLPDGDQLHGETVAPGLADPADTEDVVYRPHKTGAAPREQKSNMDRMHDAQRNYPKQGKQAAQGMQAGIAMGRVTLLPDPEEVEVQKVNFKRRPGRWFKTKVTAFYLRHRKSANILAKLTAFIALQLGVSTLAGRFEFKEDRHFVQMVLMTVMGFVLTSSLAKDGVPVGNAAFII